VQAESGESSTADQLSHAAGLARWPLSAVLRSRARATRLTRGPFDDWMRRKRVIVACVGACAALALAIVSPTVRGASRAALDLVRGKSAVFRLGCVFGPSSDAVEFRFEELLAEKYRLHCETTGGFAPSDEIVAYTSAYNFVTLRVAQLRYGREFWQRTHAEAADDVSKDVVVVEGCFSPRSDELITPSGQRYVIFPRLGVSENEWMDRSRASVPIRLTGTLTSVRAGAWNREFGPQLQPAKVEHMKDRVCGLGTKPAV
jgi:hypothetical protein